MDKWIIFGTGKTGGHLFPAITIGENLGSRGYKCLFLIQGTKMEKEVLNKRGMKYMTIHSAPFPGACLKAVWKFIYENILGICQCISLFLQYRPVFSLVTGGYTSFPVGSASLLSFVPLFIYEGNIKMGKSNVLLSPFARASFGPDKSGFGVFVKVGNPVRKEMRASGAEFPEDTNILITGGSQGSVIILKTVLKMLEAHERELKEKGVSLTIATGHNNAFWVDKFSRFSNVKALPFIHDMASAIKQASVLICRSGAMTVEENLAMGRYAIYIPFAGATGDHQYFNALIVKEREAGDLIRERLLNANSLFSKLMPLIEDKKLLQRGGERAGDLYNERHKIRVEAEILRRI